ncbi:hypothetical protein DAD99_20970 [Pseudarthrobacter sp. AB1]|nr:hypothetical protein [Pseudarthrobacter sp. AB1]
MLAASLWSASPALACDRGYTGTTINGVAICVPNSDGGVAGGGSAVVVGGGGSTVPGQAGQIVGGGMGPAPVPLPQAPAAAYVPAAPAPAAPAPAAIPAAPVQNQFIKQKTSPQNGTMPQSGTGTVDAGIAPATREQAVVPEASSAEVPSETPTLVAEAAAPSTSPAADPEVVAGAKASTEAVNGVQTSDAETTFAGFIAGALGVLVVAAGVLYWRKGRTGIRRAGPGRL